MKPSAPLSPALSPCVAGGEGGDSPQWNGLLRARALDRRRGPASAFTLIELLVVVAIIGILCALLLPVLAKAKGRASSTRCISNLRQFQVAWVAFEGDHGELPPNNDQPDAGRSPTRPSWVAGWLRLDTEPGDKADAVDTTLLTGEAYRAFGSLGPYTGSPAIYKCCLDRSTVNIGGRDLPRVRTVSMNAYMNGAGVWQNSNFLTFKQSTAIPNPSGSWVFIEEREDSINDGYFAVLPAEHYAILDTPANYHDNAGVISFADGHVELHRWVESTTLPPLQPGVHLSCVPVYTSATDHDMKWLLERTSVPVRR